jgi:thymidylate kinase
MKAHIEFCGLPGSGKTTLCGVFVGALNRVRAGTLGREAAVRVCLRRRDDGLLKNGLKRLPAFFWERFMASDYALPELQAFAGGHAGLLAHICRGLADRNVPVRRRQVILGACFRNFVELELAGTHLRPGETFVMDEGNSHRALTLYGYLDDPAPAAEIREFADLIPKPDVVFWTDAEPETCEHRMATRGKKPYTRPFELDDLTRSERLRRLEQCRDCARTVTERLRTRGVEAIRIDANGEEREAAASMATWAARLAERPPFMGVKP